jgi:hypothetical protein
MQQPDPPSAASIDSQFALVHGLSPDNLRVLLDLVPQLSTLYEKSCFVTHPASACARPVAVVDDCYRVRFELAERRFLQMKGLVHASMEAQQRMEREITALRVARSITDLGLADDCSAILASMRRLGGAGGQSVLDEVAELTRRLEATMRQNDALVRMNRDLRGVQRMQDGEDEEAAASHTMAFSASFSSPGPSVDTRLVAENETLRKHVIALELECSRLQSDAFRFEQDERLRECEDVFDRILGRERQDFGDDGDRLRRYHPVGTCSDPACQAYARRLRGGLRLAVTDAYARERAVRVNGFVRQSIEPVEALRAQKDAEIRALRERVRRFEQSTRMTGPEADEVELRSISLEILDKAAELADIKTECARAEREFARRRGVVAKLVEEERSVQEELREVRLEVQALVEERQLTSRAVNDFREEYAKLEKLRAEITLFQSGQSAAAFRQQKQDAADLAIEVENLRIERGRAVASQGGQGSGDVGGAAMVAEESTAVVAVPSSQGSLLQPPLSAPKRPKRTPADPDIFPAPDGTVIIKCRCGDFVPIGSFSGHVQAKHSNSSRNALLCGAGCGVFVVNRPIADLEKHRRTGECARRVAAIRRLMGDGC